MPTSAPLWQQLIQLLAQKAGGQLPGAGPDAADDMPQASVDESAGNTTAPHGVSGTGGTSGQRTARKTGGGRPAKRTKLADGSAGDVAGAASVPVPGSRSENGVRAINGSHGKRGGRNSTHGKEESSSDDSDEDVTERGSVPPHAAEAAEACVEAVSAVPLSGPGAAELWQVGVGDLCYKSEGERA